MKTHLTPPNPTPAAQPEGSAIRPPVLWFDPACAQYDPSDAKSLWCCSLRGGNGGVVAWAEGETPEETRDRCKTICRAVNAHDQLVAALEAVWDFWAGGDVPPELEAKIKSALAASKASR